MKSFFVGIAVFLLAAAPILLNAGQYDRALGDARNLDASVRALSIVGSPGNLDVNRTKGDLAVLPPFIDSLAASLAGVNVGPAQEIRSVSLDLGIKIKNAQGESNVIILAADIINNIKPGLDRCRLLLPSLIAELEKANHPVAETVRNIIKVVATATPAPAQPAGGSIRPSVVPTQVIFQPTPVDNQHSNPGGGLPPNTGQPPAPGNPGLIPPPYVARPTPTAVPWTPPVNNTPATAVPTPKPIGILKAPVAMIIPNHQRWVYVAQVNAGTVAVMDTKLRRVTHTLAVGRRPVAMAMDPGGKTLVVANHDSNSITVIDGRLQTVLGSVGVGLRPSDVAVTPNGKKAYVVNQGSNTVTVVLLRSLSVLKTIPVGIGPSHIEMESSGRVLYISNTQSDTVSIIDASVDEVVAEVKQ